jgi:hypothetical protein
MYCNVISSIFALEIELVCPPDAEVHLQCSHGVRNNNNDNNNINNNNNGPSDSVDDVLWHKSDGRGFKYRLGHRIYFPIYVILPAAQQHYGPGAYSASNRNVYQEYSLGGGGEVKRGRFIRLTTSSLTMIQLSKKCEILDVTQPYRPPRPVTWMALFVIYRWCSYLTGNTPIDS